MAQMFVPAQHALRALPRLVLACVLLYLGAAIVIDAQSLHLSQDLSTLSNVDMCEWSVLNGSALAASFAAVVAHADEARQNLLKADPWWLVAPTVDASFTHVRSRTINDGRKCKDRPTIKYLVTFPSVAAGAFQDTPGMCGQVQAVYLGGKYPIASVNIGLVFTAAGHNGKLFDSTAADRLRLMVTNLNRRLRQELRDPTVIKSWQSQLEAVCPTTANLVDVVDLNTPVFVVLGAILTLFVLLALGVPWLLARVNVQDEAQVVPRGNRGVPDGSDTVPAVAAAAAAAAVAAAAAAAAEAITPPPPTGDTSAGTAGLAGGAGALPETNLS